MVSNRRNYYRLLQVQPDAVAEVIKAAYRALMTLHHPDKGGDHATAVLLNEAFGVLSNPAKRAAYDAARSARNARVADARAATGRAPAARDAKAPEAAPRPAAAPARHASDQRCPMCDVIVPKVLRKTARCARCHAPLMSVQRPGVPSRPSDRRGIPRISKSDWGTLQVDWQSRPIDVRMRDLSLDGISVFSGMAVEPNQRVRVVSAAFDVVADVVTCRRMNNVYSLHARLVTAIFTAHTGGFVSTTA